MRGGPATGLRSCQVSTGHCPRRIPGGSHRAAGMEEPSRAVDEILKLPEAGRICLRDAVGDPVSVRVHPPAAVRTCREADSHRANVPARYRIHADWRANTITGSSACRVFG
jgi:hypothetical protein